MDREIQLYLASTSPRRRELLQQLGLAYGTLKVDVDETVQEHEAARDFVMRMALQKARTGWQHEQRTQPVPVLGSDTIDMVDDEIFGKPRDKQHAQEMLMRLSGRCHQVLTAVAVKLDASEDVRVNCTEVCFRNLAAEEINAYWQTGEPRDKAGAYAIQGLAAQFIHHLHGSFSAVMGLPLYETAELLSQSGVKIPGSNV